MRKRLLTISIAAVLLAFFSVPLAFIFYGGAGAAIGGLILIGSLIVLQLPAFMLLKKLGMLPTENRD